MKKKKSEPGDNTKLITSTDNKPSAREKHGREMTRTFTTEVKSNAGSESPEIKFDHDHYKLEETMLQCETNFAN